MVGDWPGTDVLGAHRAGMKAILIEERWPEPPHLPTDIPDMELLSPDAVTHDLESVASVLSSLAEDRRGVIS